MKFVACVLLFTIGVGALVLGQTDWYQTTRWVGDNREMLNIEIDKLEAATQRVNEATSDLDRQNACAELGRSAADFRHTLLQAPEVEWRDSYREGLGWAETGAQRCESGDHDRAARDFRRATELLDAANDQLGG